MSDEDNSALGDPIHQIHRPGTKPNIKSTGSPDSCDETVAGDTIPLGEVDAVLA